MFKYFTTLFLVLSISGISIVWTPNGEEDLAGYRLYRATIIGLDKSDQFSLIASPRKEETTYIDDSAEQSMSYVYVIFAFDNALNVSSPSNVAWKWDRIAPEMVKNLHSE